MTKPFYVSLKPFLNHSLVSRPALWHHIFDNENPIEVEIGFGNGEYLAKTCEQFPEINFIGFEQYCERISRTLRKLSRCQSSQVRLMRLDARVGFQRYIPERSIQKVHCLYPPPWPKKSAAKHRLFTTSFLQTINNRLIDGGILLIVTDWEPYSQWIEEQLPKSGFQKTLHRILPHYGTKFENKWVEGGQREFFEMILKKVEHKMVPLKEDVVVQSYLVEHFDPKEFKLQEFSADGISVTFKDLLYDAQRQIALIHAIISDDGFVQHVRIHVAHTAQGWRIRLAEGCMLMPTQGVITSLELVNRIILKRPLHDV